MSARVRELHSKSEVLDACGDDPFVRYEIEPGLLTRAWAVGSAVGLVRRRQLTGRLHLMAIGPEGDLAPLLAALAEGPATDPNIMGISVDQEHLELAERHFRLVAGGNWDWMWTTTPLAAHPLESEVVELDDTADAPELLELNRVGSPTAESQPGEGVTELWLGIRRNGRIVAAGAMHRTGAGAPHLAGIVTHPEHRGTGLGKAVTVALTRAGMREGEVCTLGMYSDNPTARRIYESLGYRTVHAWASRQFDRS